MPQIHKAIWPVYESKAGYHLILFLRAIFWKNKCSFLPSHNWYDYYSEEGMWLVERRNETEASLMSLHDLPWSPVKCILFKTLLQFISEKTQLCDSILFKQDPSHPQSISSHTHLGLKAHSRLTQGSLVIYVSLATLIGQRSAAMPKWNRCLKMKAFQVPSLSLSSVSPLF